MSDRTSGRLDRAVEAHRVNPTPATKRELAAAAAAHTAAFHAEQTREFLERQQ